MEGGCENRESLNPHFLLDSQEGGHSTGSLQANMDWPQQRRNDWACWGRESSRGCSHLLKTALAGWHGGGPEFLMCSCGGLRKQLIKTNRVAMVRTVCHIAKATAWPAEEEDRQRKWKRSRGSEAPAGAEVEVGRFEGKVQEAPDMLKEQTTSYTC